MRRLIARTVAAAALAAGLAVAAPLATPAALADHGQPGPGWNLIHVYPSKGECLAVGKAGMWRVDPVNGQWDEFRCDPLGNEWALWVVIWVG
jgi:hypothetical protein